MFSKKSKVINNNQETPLKLVGGTNDKLLLSIIPPAGTKRTPCDIICVVDTSGSMGSQATLKSQTGEEESHGLCVLDVVKHAVNTIVNILEAEDRLAIVSFNSTSEVNLELTKMNTTGKNKAAKTMEQLQADKNTNLWDGLHTGLEIIRKAQKDGRPSALLLLTDGEPNVFPEGGHIVALQKYKAKNEVNTGIYTFGFGYSLDSVLLDEIAVEGNGSYAFIPDCSLVGTVFINTISNILSTFASNAVLSITPSTCVAGAVGGFLSHTKKDTLNIHIGSLKYGQRRDAVVKLTDINSPVTVTLTYQRTDNSLKEQFTSKWEADSKGHDEVEVQYFRLFSCDAIREAMTKSVPEGQVKLKQLIDEITNSTVSNDPFIQDLLKDLGGQITEALSKVEWYDRWGKHFLPSIVRAHLLQQCNNFKDPGVQHYGGQLFHDLRDQADEIFRKLPPPKSSETFFTFSSNGNPVPLAAPVDMSSFNNPYGGCVSGSSLVLMADHSLKAAKDIVKEDFVMGPNGQSASVVCVVKTTCCSKVPLVQLSGGLVLTPWHPVRIGGEWKFPCSIGKLVQVECLEVYNFVLDKEHVMIINDTECVTLGHGFTDRIVCHPYWGTDQVVNDLRSFTGWKSGLIDLSPITFVRDQTGLVSSLLKDGPFLSVAQIVH